MDPYNGFEYTLPTLKLFHANFEGVKKMVYSTLLVDTLVSSFTLEKFEQSGNPSKIEMSVFPTLIGTIRFGENMCLHVKIELGLTEKTSTQNKLGHLILPLKQIIQQPNPNIKLQIPTHGCATKKSHLLNTQSLRARM